MPTQWDRGRAYWEQAGSEGYGSRMYVSGSVEQHISGRMWRLLLEIAHAMGTPSSGAVLDMGCGDGTFANRVLASNYRAVHGVDFAEQSIARASKNAAGSSTFAVVDITKPLALGRFDAVFLVGSLHHVKAAAPKIAKQLRDLTPRVIVLEPNGAHPLRKLLELTPAYRRAGEDSFTAGQIKRMFEEAGFMCADHRRVNLFPNLTPGSVFKALAGLEQIVERSPLLSHACTVNLFGFSS